VSSIRLVDIKLPSKIPLIDLSSRDRPVSSLDFSCSKEVKANLDYKSKLKDTFGPTLALGCRKGRRGSALELENKRPVASRLGAMLYTVFYDLRCCSSVP
jgi:hypothetical protein